MINDHGTAYADTWHVFAQDWHKREAISNLQRKPLSQKDAYDVYLLRKVTEPNSTVSLCPMIVAQWIKNMRRKLNQHRPR